MLHKSALKPNYVLFSPFWCSEECSIQPEPAVVLYPSIIDMHADTMSEVAAMLYKEYISRTGAQHLVVAGDAKTYLRLKELMQQYGSELDWLLPLVGDWNVLFNYQKVFMKVYFDTGFKDLAIVSEFRAETLSSLANASKFKRTHAFLLQVWEALYRHILDQYLSHCSLVTPPEYLLADIRIRLSDCSKSVRTRWLCACNHSHRECV